MSPGELLEWSEALCEPAHDDFDDLEVGVEVEY